MELSMLHAFDPELSFRTRFCMSTVKLGRFISLKQ